MTEISAKIILDSVSPQGIRLTTMHLRYPRFIHAELMTHRVFSRNARSSRAVPISKMIDEVVTNPVVPLHWGKNQPGMQAREECDEPVILDHYPDYFDFGTPLTREKAWLIARDRAVEIARAFAQSGYHKQIVNRLLEPFMHIDTLVSSTQWKNWFALRDHEDAEPHIAILAREMREAMEASSPTLLMPGQWHLPYIRPQDTVNAVDHLRNGRSIMPTDDRITKVLKKISVARCARISYTPFDGDGSIEAELDRYKRLVGSQPLHASPAEHQATPDSYEQGWLNSHHHGNFYGWRQYRKMLPNEQKIDKHPVDLALA